MKKIISMSIWGTQDRYRIGALKNIALAENLFPDWEVYLYTDDNSWIEEKRNLKVFLVHDSKLSGWFWRFIPFFEIEGYVLSRDADSRLTAREKRAIDEWIQSGKAFSIIRDHVRHFDFPMLAGMWGAKAPLPLEIHQKLQLYGRNNYYLADQQFLAEEIWPLACHDAFIHEMNTGWFKSTRGTNKNFVGQGYNEYDNPLYPQE